MKNATRVARAGTRDGVDRGWTLVLLIAFGIALAGCADAEPPADTGAEGIVTVGPMCPVVQPGLDCPDRPYAAKLTVISPTGKIITRASADADGRFRIPLNPGDYLLQAEANDGGPLPASAGYPFTVRSGSWTRLEVVMDSGIR